ncbi:hypothetical protein [Streptomyces sp. NPDC018031]|uniref:hypothetical protein n=1 Tax=Streptomyces sp. NPDC018031 TaxID=3365033 RepID=UPI0037B9D872
MAINGAGTAGEPGYALLIAAGPGGKQGKQRLMDAAAALPQLAAVAPAVLLGTPGGASVVQLVDPSDPQTVLTHLRTAAAHPGPVLVYLAGQLTLDAKQRLPHLALARTTARTARYSALPWHWLAAELGHRPPGTTTLVADLVADATVWPQMVEHGPAAERHLAAGLALYGVVAPVPAKRRHLASPVYTRAFAALLRGVTERPPLTVLHERAAQEAGLGGGPELLLGAGAESAAGYRDGRPGPGPDPAPWAGAAGTGPDPVAPAPGLVASGPAPGPVADGGAPAAARGQAPGQGQAQGQAPWASPTVRPEPMVQPGTPVPPVPPVVSGTVIPPARTDAAADTRPAGPPQTGAGRGAPPEEDAGRSTGSGAPGRTDAHAGMPVDRDSGPPAKVHPEAPAVAPSGTSAAVHPDAPAVAPSGPSAAGHPEAFAVASSGTSAGGGPDAAAEEHPGTSEAVGAGASGAPYGDGSVPAPRQAAPSGQAPAPRYPAAAGRPGSGSVPTPVPGPRPVAGQGSAAGSRAAAPPERNATPAPAPVPAPYASPTAPDPGGAPRSQGGDPAPPHPAAPPEGPARRLPDPHAAILEAARAGRHSEAAAMAAAWEQEAMRATGPSSPEAIHWLEVRADLFRLAGDSARACELWMAAARIRLGNRQQPGHPDVEGAADRAHHQWQEIRDPSRAAALAPMLIELRTQVPGRRPGALEAVRRRAGQLHSSQA